MIQPTIFADRVREAFQPTPRGVVGLVDDLLGLCRQYQLRIAFHDGHCSVRRLGAEARESLDIELPKSVFRAAIARIAAMCEEQRPGTVTPYRGEAFLAVQRAQASDSPHPVHPTTCYVSFANTPAEQRLEMRFSSSSVGDDNRFTVLLRDNRTVSVSGHALKYIENTSSTTDPGSYGILSRADGDEVLVALFRASEVIGVFSGDPGEPGA
jgi:hypothetical protein